MKKLISFFISTALIISMLVPAFSANAESQYFEYPDGYCEFVDIPENTPTEFRVSSVNETSATVVWENLDYGIDGCEILMYNDSAKVFEHKAYTKNDSYKLTGLDPNKIYTVKVRGYSVTHDNKYYYSNLSKAIDIKTAPCKIALTGAKYKSKGKVALNWNKSYNANGYMIAYSTKKNFAEMYTNYITVPSSKASFTVGGLFNGKYFFRVIPYKELNGVKYLGAASNVRAVSVKKGVSIKQAINYTKTDLSGRKEILKLTKNKVDIKKYKSTYARIKAIYNWHAKNYKKFGSCYDCNYHFNETVNALYGNSRQYDDFIQLVAGEVKNSNGKRVEHKWPVFFVAGKQFIVDPRLQGYTGNYKGNAYFFVTQKSSYGKKLHIRGWLFCWRNMTAENEYGRLAFYK